ncbi:vacuolar sorting protein 39 domain 1-domain-containing protein [Phlyctochytrium arcticum]|nr:vacuolar sorting protein 39 domain 1-domain-containing protein [Phlyctochytrium arcticum]
MYSVFHTQSIIENLPLKITCLQTRGSDVIVGTEHGSLLLYHVEEDPSFTITLAESKTSLARKRIDTISILPGTNLIAVLSDGQITIQDGDSLALRETIGELKAVSFLHAPESANVSPVVLATGAESQDTSDESHSGDTGMFCVAVKKSVLFYQYQDTRCRKIREVHLADRPRDIKWTQERLYVASSRSIIWIDVPTGSILEMYTFRTSIVSAFGQIAPSKKGGLLLSKWGSEGILVTREGSTMAMSHNGDVIEDFHINWTRTPETVLVWAPYVIGLFPSCIEVRRMRSSKLVQEISLSNCQILESGQSLHFATSNSVARLLAVDFEDQIEQLITNNQYSEAQILIEDLQFSSPEDKAANVIRVRGMYAHHIFTTEHKYQEAFQILRELQASPLDIVNLYPDLTSNAHDLDMDGPSAEVSPSPYVSDKEALVMLMNYLGEQRSVLGHIRQQQELAGLHKTRMAASDDASADETRYLSEVVDTTLLKVYLRINERLVGPLLRTNNYCDVLESEELLLQQQKYDEVVDLYRGKKLHRKALDFLVRRAASPDSTAAETSKMVSYLQALSYEQDLDLIFEYATWILQRDVATGLQIFTEHYEEVSPKARVRIVDYLASISNDLAVRYLEYLVNELHDDSSQIHDQLIMCYVSILNKDLKDKSGYAGPMLPKRGGDVSESNKNFWSVRRKIANFLGKSTAYDPEKILLSLPDDALYEERATVLSRLFRHEEAIAIYIDKVHNFLQANRYCEQHYDASNPLSRDIFLILLRRYLEMLSKGAYSTEELLTFLSLYGSSMDATKVLPMLPDSLPLADLLGYFQRSLHDMHRTRNMNEVVKNLLQAKLLQSGYPFIPPAGSESQTTECVQFA